MNAAPLSSANCPDEMNGHGSDTDSDRDETPDYYQPISALGDDDSGSDSDPVDYVPSSSLHNLPNGFLGENGIASLSMNEAADQKSSEEEEDDDGVDHEEEETAGQASNSAILRAFREDDSRRSAPLQPENAVRVMEAMRGVSFGGSAPDWARTMPEDQWIGQLRRMRQPPSGSTN